MKYGNSIICGSRFASALGKILMALVLGWSAQTGWGQANLLKNANFSNGLTDWKTEGDVTTDTLHAVLRDTGADPVLYQAVTGNSYAYELRFDIDLGGVSDRPGSGSFDTIRFTVYEGDTAATLTPATAAKEQVLIEGNASGLTALVSNAQIAPNPVLGFGYASVVVEIFSSYAAIAPAVKVFNNNGLVDTQIRITNVRLIAVDRGRLSNISNRGAVGTGPNRMIASFVLSGPNKKSAVVRGAGPWLAGLGVPNALEDPAMELRTLAGTVVASNNDWEVGNNKTELIDAMTKVGAWGIPFADGSKDSALFQNEGGGLSSGQYSVVVSGNNLAAGQSQIAIAEIYDYDVFGDGPTELVNISNRGNTSKGAGAQIPGFVITGNRGRIVLIRVVGPSLAAFVSGTLDDPLLVLTQNVGGKTEEVARNDDYGTAENVDQILSASERVGAFALLPDAKDSAILMSLEPGIYTAQAQVKQDGVNGVVLVEVYMVSNTRPIAGLHPVFVSTAGSTVLPMDQILSPTQDAEGDLLSIASYTQPDRGEITENVDGELVYTNELGFVGQTIFSYSLTDGEYESAPGVIGLNVAPPGSKIWQGGSSGNFSDPANWAGGTVPGATDDVWIVPIGETAINLNQDTQLKSLRVGGIGSKVTFTIPSGRTLTTTGTAIVARESTLHLNNGTLGTGDNLVVAGNLKWSNGTMTGNGATIIEPGGVAQLEGSQLRLDGGRDFTNRGRVIQTGSSYLYATNGNSDVTNAAAALWDVNNGSGRFAYQDNSSSLSFLNSGDLYKNSTTGAVVFGWTGGTSNFTNQASGRVMVQGGTLEFQGAGSGTHNGELMIAPGAEALITYGTHTFSSGSTISSTGTLNVSTNSTVTIAAANVFEKLELSSNGVLNYGGSLTVTDFSQASSSRLKGDGDMIVTGTFSWTSGTQDGAGATIIQNGATATLNTSTLTLNGNRKLTNNGELTQLGSALLYPAGGSQSVVTNGEDGVWTLNMSNNRHAAYPDSSSRLDFNNAGVLNKQNNSNIYSIGWSQGTSNFINTGTINVPAGVLEFDGNGSGTQDGTIAISSGAEVKLNRGTHTFGEEAVISDTGTLHVTGVAVASVPNDLSLESLRISNGTLNASGDITVATFVQSSGAFTSSKELLVTDTLTVTGGTQSGAGVTVLGAEGTGTLSSGRWLFTANRGFTNRGDLTLSGNSGFYASGGSQSTLTNAADATLTSNLATGQYILYSNDGSTTTNLVNQGTLTKANLIGINYIGLSNHATNITNAASGTIEVAGGTLQLQGGGTSTYAGTLTIAENAVAQFHSGTHTLQSGSTVTNSGTFEVNGATVSLAGALTIPNLRLSSSSGTLTAGGALTVENYNQSTGTLVSSADMTVSKSFTWTGGFQSGSGTTIIGSEATASLTTGSTLYMRGNRKLTNNGTLNIGGNSSLYADQSSNAVVTNTAGATFTLNSNNGNRFAYNTSDSSMTFINHGTLTKTNSGTTYFGTNGGTSTFTNSASGTVDVQGGILWFDGSGAGTHQGALTVAEFAKVSFRYGAHTFASGSSLNATASLSMESGNGSLTFAQAATFAALGMNSSTTVNVNANVTVGSFTQTNGTLGGSANLTVTTTASLASGVQTGSGTTIFGSGATVNHSGLIYLESGRKIVNQGTYQLTGNGYWSARGGLGASTVTNASGASWTITGTRLVTNDGSSSISFVNDGTLTKTSVNVTQFGVFNGLSTFVNNGTFVVEAGAFQFNSTATATFAGGSTARLTTAGQASNKVIDGNGTINFGGTLEVVLAVGFAPSNGQTITLLDYGSRSGTFATHSAPQGYASVTPTYNATSLDIQFNQ